MALGPFQPQGTAQNATVNGGAGGAPCFALVVLRMNPSAAGVKKLEEEESVEFEFGVGVTGG